MKKKLIPFLLLASAALAQPPGPAPDCTILYTRTTAGSTNAFDNRQTGCSLWSFSPATYGFTAATITLQSAPDTGGTAGTFVTFSGQDVILGSNPYSAVGAGAAAGAWIIGYQPWMRVTISGLTGSGGVIGSAYGWKTPSPGSLDTGVAVQGTTGQIDVNGSPSTLCTTGTCVVSIDPAFPATPTGKAGYQLITNGTTSSWSTPSGRDVTGLGVTCNGTTDDTAALNAAIAATNQYDVLLFPIGCKVKITSTINIHGKYGLVLRGINNIYGGPDLLTQSPSIYWYGANGGTMVDIDDSGNILMEGLALFSASAFGPGTAGADVVINVDQTLGIFVTTTNNTFNRLAIVNPQQRPTFVGIQFNKISDSNVEHMLVSNSLIACTYIGTIDTSGGIGIYQGISPNSLGHVYERNAISTCAQGIFIGGSATAIYNEMETNTAHFTANSAIAPVVIGWNDSENTHNFFSGSIPGGSQIIGNRIGACSPASMVGCISFTGGVQVSVSSNQFDAGAYYPISAAAGGNPAVLSMTNAWPDITNTAAGIKTFHPYGYMSLMEGNNFVAFQSPGNALGMVPAAGLGMMDYSYTLQKWVKSEDGGTVTPLTGTIASGAKALATGAISSGACTSAQTDTATGTLTTDTVTASFNGDPTAITGYIPSTSGMLTIMAYPTSNTVNFKVCNNTGSSITPGAVTINWRIVR